MKHDTIALYVIAGLLAVLVAMFASWTIYYAVIVPVQQEQARQELIRREPWRAFE